jgi:hypothetical protein
MELRGRVRIRAEKKEEEEELRGKLLRSFVEVQ